MSAFPIVNEDVPVHVIEEAMAKYQAPIVQVLANAGQRFMVNPDKLMAEFMRGLLTFQQQETSTGQPICLVGAVRFSAMKYILKERFEMRAKGPLEVFPHDALMDAMKGERQFMSYHGALIIREEGYNSYGNPFRFV